MQGLQKQPLHLLLGFQQPKHKNVIPIIDLVIKELQQSKTEHLTIYDQFGILEQRQYKVGNLNIKSENQKCLMTNCMISINPKNNCKITFQQVISLTVLHSLSNNFSQKCVLLGLPFEYLKGGEIQFCDIDQFDSQNYMRFIENMHKQNKEKGNDYIQFKQSTY